MPVYDHSPMFARLTDAPAEATPLYAVLAVLHQALSWRPAGSCVLSCHQIAQALHHLGFTAEPVAACATLYRTTATFAETSELGVWKQPPDVRPDGMTTGHMIVWVPSFGVIVDPTLVQDPLLLTRARTNPAYSVPVVVPAPADPEELLHARLTTRLDDDLYASWLLLPEWTQLVDAVLDEELRTVIELGGLGLATDALHALQLLAQERDLMQLRHLSGRLGALMTGRVRLPPMPKPSA